VTSECSENGELPLDRSKQTLFYYHIVVLGEN
jgi:hypothetical protein